MSWKGRNNPKYRHGWSNHPLYDSVLHAFDRCTNEKNERYSDWGGRGIEFKFDPWWSAIPWLEENLGLPPEGLTLNRMDNDDHYRPGNLEYSTKLEQVLNRRKQKNTISKFRGLGFNKKANKWTAYIRLNGIKKNLGYFIKEEDAAEAYLEVYYNHYKKFPPEFKPIPVPKELLCAQF